MRVKSEADTLTEFVNDREVNYKVQSGDNLYIKIVSMDEVTNEILNPMGSGGGGSSSSGGGNYLNSYTVSEEGYLEFPLVGKLYVKDLTIEETTNLLTDNLNHQYWHLTPEVLLFSDNPKDVGIPGDRKLHY